MSIQPTPNMEMESELRARVDWHDKPATNLIETWGSYVVQMALPGIDAASVLLTMVGRDLHITGRRHLPRVEGGSAIWIGLPATDFSYTFTLPSAVDGDSGTAEYWHGILSVVLPKMAHLRSPSIAVEIRA
jgi:HSP20 family protein